VGYSHPEVVAAVKRQAELFFHSSINVVLYETYVRLAKKLSEITPGSFEKKTMFVNSGAEAVENAVKIARRYTKKTDIVCFEGAFHGRTLLAMALTSKVKPYSYGFGPFPPGIHKLPYAYCYRCAYGLAWPGCGLRCAERLNEIFEGVASPDDIAAVIIEPVLGEGGFVVPPDGFVDRILSICAKHGILVIADEVQTGFYRTGKMFASHYWKAAPDIVASAKSLSGGLPLGAVTARKDIIEAPQAGGIGGTFGGNPLSCAAALAVIDIMEREGFAERANAVGRVVLERFESMAGKYPIIGDVRGRGAMCAVELVRDRGGKTPAAEETKEVLKSAYGGGLAILNAGLYGNIVRTLAPLVITDDQLAAGLDVLEGAIERIRL
jgi:4-aminobutyrate aminotransferase/(S)-3-amino-2-methylpropionate transaminase